MSETELEPPSVRSSTVLNRDLPLPIIRSQVPMQITLARNIAAIQIEHAEDGQEKLGVISRLPQGAELDICGPGFDSRTAKVDWCGQYYFVFIQDLREQAAAAGA